MRYLFDLAGWVAETPVMLRAAALGMIATALLAITFTGRSSERRRALIPIRAKYRRR